MSTTGPNPTPFFHAQHIGSLLRPDELLKTRFQYEQGKTSVEALTKAEDKAVKDIVKMQTDTVGIPCITDGEFRRHMFYDGMCDAKPKG